MRAITRYILLTAARDWLFLGLFIAIIVASAVSLFLGSTALSEQYHMKLSYISGSTRLILSVGMILFICFHVRRAFENREIEFTISRPISRTTLLLSYFLSFAILSFLLVTPVIALIWILFKPTVIGILAWASSIYFELLLISSFALLSSLILNSAVVAVMGCFGFYIISRMMGFAVSYIIVPSKLNNIDINIFLELLLKLLSTIMPRLDLFAKSKWLVYGTVEPMALYIIIAQSAIYIPLILLMSAFDFNRKQF